MCFPSVFAVQPTSACDFDCRAKRLSDQMARLAVLGRVPMLGLMLELEHRRSPTTTGAGSMRVAVCVPGIVHLTYVPTLLSTLHVRAS